jgi:hypothetical protein
MRTPSAPQIREKPEQPTAATARKARQKAALAANMGRRKAQAKARSAGETASGETDSDG